MSRCESAPENIPVLPGIARTYAPVEDTPLAAQMAPVTADDLDPAESLLDALSDALAGRVARMPGRSCVDRRTAVRVGKVLVRMRPHIHRALFVDEVGRVKAAIATERDSMRHLRRWKDGRAS
jgi:hypothetical protein